VLVHSTINANLSSVVDYDAKAIKLALATHAERRSADKACNFAAQCICYICNKGCVSHCGLAAIYTKMYLKAKEELWKLKYYFTMQKYNLQKSL
jgi:hypothetical protein